MRVIALFLSSITAMMSLSGCSLLNTGYNKVETVSVFPSPSAELSKLDLTDNSEITIDNVLYNIPAPDFTLEDEQGNAVSLSDYSGQIVVLCFFSTWSKNCTESFEFLSQVASDFSEVNFLAISTGERRDMSLYENRCVISESCREKGLDIKLLFDADNSVYDSLYYVKGNLPMIYVVDGSQTIRSILSGSITSYSELKPYVTAVVKYIVAAAGAEMSEEEASPAPEESVPPEEPSPEASEEPIPEESVPPEDAPEQEQK